MKKCPHCAEEIQDAAVVCKHCGRDLATGAKPIQTVAILPEKKKTSVAAWGCLTVIALFVFGLIISVVSPSKPRPDAAATSAPARARIEATAQFTGTQFKVMNTGAVAWTDTAFEINGGLIEGGYSLRVGDVKAGETVTAGALQFAKPDGTRFNPILVKPQKLQIQAKVNGVLDVRSVRWN